MSRSDDRPSGDLWFGRHAGDDDILVLDSAGVARTTFFSLTQLRPRTFPTAMVDSRIHEISDPAERAAAEGRYRQIEALQAERERERADEAGRAQLRQKEQILEMHRLFLSSRGIEYRGVRHSADPGERPRRRPTTCKHCGIRLDDFVETRCAGCETVLCSCGACRCVAVVPQAD